MGTIPRAARKPLSYSAWKSSGNVDWSAARAVGRPDPRGTSNPGLVAWASLVVLVALFLIFRAGLLLVLFFVLPCYLLL